MLLSYHNDMAITVTKSHNCISDICDEKPLCVGDLPLVKQS